ncbi:ArnT family glycosyltransferase [Granulicella cerasi]|uniref:ArnT family glycosyltransferase n=1 Tax=Granulicella cerasi TaxID=741063 RepID=A0ABW1Z580_9BACT|nr:glycosyltransferase family 39 protein [Granulicella cerasi]
MPRPVSRSVRLLLLLSLWAAAFLASSISPPLLDDADATHSQAAQYMLHHGDWVTLHVDGIRYLEKAPLPYWIVAVSMKLFGENAFAAHLPLALTVLGLALLAWRWAARAFDEDTAFLAALMTLTSTGVFLFTRVFIPDVLLALLLCLSLYAALRALEGDSPRHAYLFWIALALAVLTKGLVALVFAFAAIGLFLLFTRRLRELSKLRPVTGTLLMLAIAAPWHILAGLRNTGGANGHGFFWFYFVNEHILRFLGRRLPRDYNKMPAAAYWLAHLVWLFPWSLFLPAAFSRRQAEPRSTFGRDTLTLLALYSAFVLLFFSLSTNQEYYTLPAYLPLLMLLASRLTQSDSSKRITLALASFTVLGAAIAITLFVGLWQSRALPFNPDIGSALARRAVGNYTLSMSHFFDLTGPSFAALRLPAIIAMITFAIGPAIALTQWTKQRRLIPAATTVAITTTVFFVAAHIALVRFAPMLSSEAFATCIRTLEQRDPTAQTALYGDQAYGSSIPFYLGQEVALVDGRSTSMLFGSTFPDAPPIFLTPSQYAAQWGIGPRKLLFVPDEKRQVVDQLLGTRSILVMTQSGKALLTDRPLP